MGGICPPPPLPSLSWVRGSPPPGALARGLPQALQGGGRWLHVTVAEAAGIQQVVLRGNIQAAVLGSFGVLPGACPLQRGLEKFSDPPVFLGRGLPHNLQLPFHFSERNNQYKENV